MRSEIEQALQLLQRGIEPEPGEPGPKRPKRRRHQNTEYSFSVPVCGQREDAEDTHARGTAQVGSLPTQIRQSKAGQGCGLLECYACLLRYLKIATALS